MFVSKELFSVIWVKLISPRSKSQSEFRWFRQSWNQQVRRLAKLKIQFRNFPSYFAQNDSNFHVRCNHWAKFVVKWGNVFIDIVITWHCCELQFNVSQKSTTGTYKLVVSIIPLKTSHVKCKMNFTDFPQSVFIIKWRLTPVVLKYRERNYS